MSIALKLTQSPVRESGVIFMSEKHPTDNSTSLSIGGEELSIGFQVGDKMYAFTPRQTHFLINLQKLKNVAAASLSVDKPEEWGKKFLDCAKFKRYVLAKLNQFSDKNSLTIDWWYQFGKWAAEGKKDLFRVACAGCSYTETMLPYEIESTRQDDMTLAVPCPRCTKVMAVEEASEPFRPTREQIVAWQDLGSRLIPKIERVHHQFENSEIVFESTEEKQ